jgi:glycosyltransferase involved in cell wall biosynthesis
MKLFMTCDAVGGVWQYANDLAAALAGQGVEVVLAVMGPNPSSPRPCAGVHRAAGPQAGGQGQTWMPGQARHDGIKVISTDLPLDWLASDPDEVMRAGRAIAALAAEHRADIIHLNSPALAAAGRFPAPVVAVAHGCVGTWWAAAHGTAPDPAFAWHGELMRAGLLAADAVVAPSAAYAATVQQHYDLPSPPMAVHNGRVPTLLAATGPVDHVFTAGRLWDRVKRTDLLDQVAERLPVPFRAAGPTTAPHGEAVAPRHLTLLGTLPEADLAAEYAAQPIFVSAARFEPFGLAVLEAAQAGCPLVLSGIDTFRELWTGAALFVPEETAEAYVAAIERVRTEPGLREHLGEAARLRASRYTPEATAAAMLGIYRALRPEARRAA